MLPAQGRQVVQQLVGNDLPLATQRFYGAPEIDGVPQDDRGDDQVEPAGPVLLSFAGPVTDPADLGPAIKEAVAVVKTGQPALVNVVTQPR